MDLIEKMRRKMLSAHLNFRETGFNRKDKEIIEKLFEKKIHKAIARAIEKFDSEKKIIDKMTILAFLNNHKIALDGEELYEFNLIADDIEDVPDGLYEEIEKNLMLKAMGV